MKQTCIAGLYMHIQQPDIFIFQSFFVPWFFAYRLTTGFNNQSIKSRGPMIAQLVAGNGVAIRNKKRQRTFPIEGRKIFVHKTGYCILFFCNGR